MRIFLTLTLAGLFCGCAMPAKKPSMALEDIKTVAVVGYTLDVKQNQAKAFVNGFKFKTESGKVPESPLSSKIYTDLIRTLKSSSKWSVLSTSKVRNNALVKSYYVKKNNRIQSGAAVVPQYYDRFQKVGVPQEFYISSRKTNKAELAKALGVDALIIYHVTTEISKPMSIGSIGIGGARYGSDIQMTVFDRNGVEVFDLYASGGNKSPQRKKTDPELAKFGNDLNAYYSDEALVRSVEVLSEKTKAQF